MPEPTVGAVLFDLDDTLYPQSSWLTGAWRSVAERGTEMGLDGTALLDALVDIAAEGSDRGHIIDRALARVGAPVAQAEPLVDAFRAHAPDHLPTYSGVRAALELLAQHVPLGLVTDGDSSIQRAKLRALQLDRTFAVVVSSDELGREHRKPDPLPFETALAAVGVAAAAGVFVGDRPGKDVAGARAAGLRAIRVRTGEYASQPDVPRPWASVSDVPAAVAFLLSRCFPDQCIK